MAQQDDLPGEIVIWKETCYDAVGKEDTVRKILQEQKRIVSILDRFNTLCNDISEGLPAEIEARQKQYEYYRDNLLTFKKRRE